MIPEIHGTMYSLPYISPVGSFLWLEADSGVTVNGSGHVTQVLDQSGNGRHMVQSVSGTNTTVVSNAVNGLPAFAMTNSRHVLNVGAGTTGAIWIMAVVKFDPTATTAYLYDADTASRIAHYVTPTDFVGFAGQVANVGAYDSNMNLNSFRFRGGSPTSSRFSKNGGTLINYDFLQNTLQTLQIGQRTTGTNPFVGQLAAFVMETDDIRAAATIAYLKEKYAR